MKDKMSKKAIIKPIRPKKYKFPKNPMETEFMKIWHETIEREDFKELKKEITKMKTFKIEANFEKEEIK